MSEKAKRSPTTVLAQGVDKDTWKNGTTCFFSLIAPKTKAMILIKTMIAIALGNQLIG